MLVNNTAKVSHVFYIRDDATSKHKPAKKAQYRDMFSLYMANWIHKRNIGLIGVKLK